jgi:hypothetical protein
MGFRDEMQESSALVVAETLDSNQLRRTDHDELSIASEPTQPQSNDTQQDTHDRRKSQK